MSLQIEEPSPNTAVGIDLGTTHSVVAHASHGEVHVLGEERLVPSVVQMGEVPQVGLLALEAFRNLPSLPPTFSSKRHMEQGDTPLPGSSFTPIEVATEILRTLKAQAERALGYEVTQAVITVPAHFSDKARLHTKEAGERVGLEILRLLAEPTAAAMAYGLESGGEGLYGVYDLGGGTFDFSVLKLHKGIFRVIATGGEPFLGGDDFDQLLLNFWEDRHPELSAFLPHFHTLLLSQVRPLRHLLSKEHVIDGALSIQDSSTSLNIRVSMTRGEFEALIHPLFSKTLECMKRTLEEGRLKADDLQGLILVGGATRTPLVRESLKSQFGNRLKDQLNPDEVVALGAALHAEALTTGQGTLLLDVLSLPLGLETAGEQIEILIPKNSPLPIARTQTFTTQVDGQTAIIFHIVQGTSESVAECISLGRFVLRDLPPVPAGALKVRVTFQVDADGLLSITAEEETSGKIIRHLRETSVLSKSHIKSRNLI